MEAPHMEKKEDMRQWIRNVQRWIEENSGVNEKAWLDEPATIEIDTDSVLDTILWVCLGNAATLTDRALAETTLRTTVSMTSLQSCIACKQDSYQVINVLTRTSLTHLFIQKILCLSWVRVPLDHLGPLDHRDCI
jgi:hypothetical protein